MATAKKAVPAVKKSTAVALGTSAFSEDIEALKNRLAAPSGDKIKIENKQFNLPSGAKADELDVVIVDFVYFNAYYENAYQKGVVVPPSCLSLHPEPKGAVPSPNGSDVQCDGCDGCPQNQFGSSGKGKACQNRVLIAVLPADADESTPFSILDLPPTSIKGFSAYVSSVAGALQRPPYGVVTNVSCDENETYAKVIFADPQPFDMDVVEDAERVAMIRSRRAEARTRLMTEPDLTVSANDAAPAKRKTALKAPVKRRA